MVHDRGVDTGERARAAQQPGGRLPPPHRSDPGGLTMAMSTPAAVRGRWSSSFALYKRIWRSNLLGSLLQPLLYLLGMGVGVGALVDSGTASTELLGGVDYVAFLAPALLATTAMIVVAQEAMWPVMDGFTWSNAYRAMAATPLRPRRRRHRRRAVARDPGRSSRRAGSRSCWRVFPTTRSWGLIPAVPFAVLTGMAFARPLTAWSSTREARRSVVPGDPRASASSRCSCSPARSTRSTQLPGWLQPVAQVTPLYHGVELCRGAVLGTLGDRRRARARRRARSPTGVVGVRPAAAATFAKRLAT